METTIRNQLESISEEGRTSLASWMERHTLAVRDVADGLRDARLAPSPQLQDRLGQVKRLLPDLYNMYVADATATTVAFYPPVNERGESTIGPSFADRPYVRELRATHRPVISDVFRGRGGVFSPIVTVSVPIMKDGRFRGYVLGALNLDRMSSWLESFVRPWGAEATLIDWSGAVIASTRRTLRTLERYGDLDRAEPSPLGPEILLIPPTNRDLPPIDAGSIPPTSGRPALRRGSDGSSSLSRPWGTVPGAILRGLPYELRRRPLRSFGCRRPVNGHQPHPCAADGAAGRRDVEPA